MPRYFLLLSLACVLLGVSAASDLRAAGVSSTVITVPSVSVVTERDYRWYSNIDALTPTAALADENVSTTVPTAGTVLRLRANIGAETLPLNTGTTFSLQYANSTSGPWTTLSTSTNWIFADDPGVADGQIIVTTVLSASDVGESYSESNPTAASPNAVIAGQEGEWDWVMQNNTATTSAPWFFRMIYSSGTALDAYTNYPMLSAIAVSTSTATTTPGGGGGSGGGTYAGGGGFPLPPFHIETEKPPPTPCDSPIVERVDLSGDCRIDMVDLSILMYYYHRTGPEIAEYDFNENNSVDLFDVSVMMYYWTG
ncbi:MAG: hypothetical protein RL681_598 [Candidatus Parcubacteria bacterium]|jgi:hypothetical protein